jgi:predicted DNA binding CopG/RHH family protein
MKAVQYISPEYLEHCKKMSTDEIAEFLESYRLLHQASQVEEKSKLISIKMPEHLLRAFRGKCKLHGMKYQTQIKRLMLEWVQESK